MSEEITDVNDIEPQADGVEDTEQATEKTAEELKQEIESLRAKNQEVLGSLRKTKDQNKAYEQEKERAIEAKLKEENNFKELSEKQNEKLQKLGKVLEEKLLRAQLEKTYSAMGVPSDKLSAAMDLSSDYLTGIEFDKETFDASEDSLKSYADSVLNKYASLNLTKVIVAEINDSNPKGTQIVAKSFTEASKEKLKALGGL